MSAALLALRESLLPNCPYGYLVKHDSFGYLVINPKTRHHGWVKQENRATKWMNAFEAKEMSSVWNKTKVVKALEPKQRSLLEEEEEEEESFTILSSSGKWSS